MRDAYVPLVKRISRGQIIRNAGLIQLWVYLLGEATFYPKTEIVQVGAAKQTIELKMGEVFVNVAKVSRWLNQSESTLRRNLDRLVKNESITMEPSHFGVKVKIVNARKYWLRGNQPADNGGGTDETSTPVDTKTYGHGTESVEGRSAKGGGTDGGTERPEKAVDTETCEDSPEKVEGRMAGRSVFSAKGGGTDGGTERPEKAVDTETCEDSPEKVEGRVEGRTPLYNNNSSKSTDLSNNYEESTATPGGVQGDLFGGVGGIEVEDASEIIEVSSFLAQCDDKQWVALKDNVKWIKRNIEIVRELRGPFTGITLKKVFMSSWLHWEGEKAKARDTGTKFQYKSAQRYLNDKVSRQTKWMVEEERRLAGLGGRESAPYVAVPPEPGKYDWIAEKNRREPTPEEVAEAERYMREFERTQEGASHAETAQG